MTAKQKYEYKFVRIGEGWLSVRKRAAQDYQQVIHDYARDGWRLVQIFAPSIGVYGATTFYELVLEREIQP